MTFRVEGAEDLRRLGQQMKDAGDRKLKNNVAGAIRKSARPAGEKILAEAAESMPKSGGYAERLRTKKFSVRSALTGPRATVSLVFKPGGRGLSELDKGNLRHPVFGNRGVWASQKVPAGRLTASLERQGPEVKKDVLAAVNETLNEAARGF